MRALATWCFRHRRIVLAGWLVAVAALFGASRLTGSAYSNSFSLPNTDSAKAINLLAANAPKLSGDREQVVVATTGAAKLTDPAVRAQVDALLGRLGALPDVTGVVSPYSPAGAGQMNAAHTVAFANLGYDKRADLLPTSAAITLVNTARSFDTPQLKVAVGGELASQATKTALSGVGIGIAAAAIVLLAVFGSLLAASLPLVATLLALLAATSVIGMVTHLIKMPDFSSQLVLLIGLGVGVDYSLFIVTRFRQGLQAGLDVGTAIVTSVKTSGRAVLFAGAVVCIALLGMIALGVGLLTGLGVAASIGVLFTMATSLTLVPAMLGFMGHRVLSRRQRTRLRHGIDVSETGMWWRWSNLIAGRPYPP